jgi:serine/threonine protein kinase/Flp pilus assembly protein TadD
MGRLPSDNEDSMGSESQALIGHLADDMSRRWSAGARPLTEEYLAGHPQLRDRPELAVELIYEEICLREEYEPRGAVDDVLRRFPAWRPQLQALLNCHRILGEGVRPRFPAPGEVIADFRILAELGRGAEGRVFLAAESALADRLVVLKVVPCASREHLSLARLQHTHIVPVYSVRDDETRDVRVLCMPYFGGVTFDRILARIASQPPDRRTAGLLVAALRDAGTSAPRSAAMGKPNGPLFGRATFVEAVCWVGACLADALQYAHDRGLVHLDLKPSNVLLAADGQPMLLDFHLACAPIPAGGKPQPWLGGTPGYMAPEHREAYEAVRDGGHFDAGVDGRADVYALGLLLCEMLAGGRPTGAASGARWLRRRNPAVTSGLADVLAKCLAAEPAARYAQATDLAEDLRRHLANLPLRGVGNRSWSERWWKWRRRSPAAPALLATAAVALAAGGLFTVNAVRQVQSAEKALHDGGEQLQQLHYDEAVGSFRHGVALIADLPFVDDLRSRLGGQLRRAEQRQAVRELHAATERIRTVCGSEPLRDAEARTVEELCRTLWQRRDLVTRGLRLSSNSDPDGVARADLQELAVLWSDLRLRLSAGDPAVAHRDALDILAEAETLFGPSCAIDDQRQAHAAALGQSDVARSARERAAARAPTAAWEHIALGRSLIRAGSLDAASAHFERALELSPTDLWANFYRGKCAFLRERTDDAIESFTACVALAPDRAWCYFNRGRAREERGLADGALRDYDQALRLDPSLAAAAMSRAMLHYRQGRYEDAFADLRHSREIGADAAAVQYNSALVHLARGDRVAALASLDDALQVAPDHPEARALRDDLRRVP